MSILSKIIETTVAQFVPDKKRDALSYAHRIIGKPVSRVEELRQTSDKLTVWNKSIQKHSRRNFLGASLATLALGVSCSPQKEREKENTMTTGPFHNFYQLAYVTNDLERAMKVFAEVYDVPRWKEFGEVTLALDGGDSARIRLALTFAGSLQLELIEPIGGNDGIYRELLPSGDFGLKWHHTGYKVPSLESLESLREKVTGRGDRYVIGGGDPKSAKFFYADARHRLGHFLEYIYLSPEREEFHASFPRN